MTAGIIIKAISSFYYAECDGKIYECKARGNFRKTGVSPVVGDRVEITVTGDGKGVVEKVCERKNILLRPTVANIDKLFIVSSYQTPSPDTVMIDRLTAISVFHGIEPIIVFNKCDMGDFSDFQRIYTNADFKCYVVSALGGDGIENIKKELEGCICAFAGNSGVGKSSILNAVFGDEVLETGEVSEKLGRGRHTTRHTKLIKHKFGGYVADTPGFSAVEEGDNTFEFKSRLIECFPDLYKYSGDCRFSSCTHTCEKGCAVINAVNGGDAEKSRHNSYKTVFDELKGIQKWNSNFKKG